MIIGNSALIKTKCKQNFDVEDFEYFDKEKGRKGSRNGLWNLDRTLKLSNVKEVCNQDG